MKWIKIASIILGSSLFFPVSCTTSLFVGTRVIAKLDERVVAKGDELHSHFRVVATPGEKGKPFQSIKLSELSGVKSRNGEISFIIPKKSGTLDTGGSNISYNVIAEDGPELLIEVVETYHDGDNTIWSRYKATHSNITPISSKMFYFGYMFSAIPYAFGIALILYIIGQMLKRRIKVLEVSPVAS